MRNSNAKSGKSSQSPSARRDTAGTGLTQSILGADVGERSEVSANPNSERPARSLYQDYCLVGSRGNIPAILKISPAPSAGWSVVGGYGDRPFVFPTKGEAVSFFLAWAEKHQPYDVHICDDAGNLERNITFPGGNHRRASGSERRQMQIGIAFPDGRREERRSHA